MSHEIGKNGIPEDLVNWKPDHYQRWKDSKQPNRFHRIIGGHLCNYDQNGSGSWTPIDTTWVEDHGTWKCETDVLKAYVNPDGSSTCSVKWHDGEEYEVRQKLLDIGFVDKQTKAKSSIGGIQNKIQSQLLNSSIVPEVSGNVINFKNIVDDVNLEITKNHSGLAYKFVFGNNFLSSASIEHSKVLSLSKKDNMLFNKMEVKTINCSLTGSQNPKPKIGRIVKDFGVEDGVGNYHLKFPNSQVEYDDPDPENIIQTKVDQDWTITSTGSAIGQIGKGLKSKIEHIAEFEEHFSMDEVDKILAINPNTVLKHNDTTEIGAAGIEDAYIRAAAQDNNYGAATVNYIIVGYESLIRVIGVAAALGESATISAAVCSLRISYQNEDGEIKNYRIFKPWVEGDENGVNNDDGDVTDNDWASDANEWTTAGCDNADDAGVDNSGDGTGADRKATAEDAVTVTTINTWYSWDISSDLAQGWYDGTINEEGIKLMNTVEQDGQNGFDSAEHATAANRPRFSFTYTTGGGTPDQSMLSYKIFKSCSKH